MPNDIPHGAAILAEIRAEMNRPQPPITHRDIATALGVNRHSVSSWLNGTTSIRLGQLLAICDLLGVDLALVAARAKKDTD